MPSNYRHHLVLGETKDDIGIECGICLSSKLECVAGIQPRRDLFAEDPFADDVHMLEDGVGISVGNFSTANFNFGFYSDL